MPQGDGTPLRLRPPVTLRDVADRAGYSITTASRVLAGRGEVQDATREAIYRAASELGYSPTAPRRRGRSRTSRYQLLDLVLGHFDDAWSDEVVVGVRNAAAAAGLDLVLTSERAHPDDDWPQRVRSRGTAGVVLGLLRPTAAQLRVLTSVGTPVVLLDPRSDPPRDIASVRATDWQGGFDAGQYLLGQGIRRFLIVSGVPHYRFGRARVDGFRAALSCPESSHGAVHIDEIDASWSSAGAYWAARNALHPGATRSGRVGVFACNDGMARGVYAAASQLGLSIPADLAVVGFDDLPFARRMRPPLTTVRQPIREMAETAVRLIVTDNIDRGSIELKTALVVRESA